MTAMGLERTRPQSTQYDDDHDDDVLSEDKGDDQDDDDKDDNVDDRDDGDDCEDNSDNNDKEEDDQDGDNVHEHFGQTTTTHALSSPVTCWARRINIKNKQLASKWRSSSPSPCFKEPDSCSLGVLSFLYC